MHASVSGTDILASIVSSSNDAIIGKDRDGVVTSWNEAAERLFGFSAAYMIGQPILRIVPPNRIEEERLILRRAVAGENLNHFETERVTKDGTLIPVSLTISPIHDRAGNIIGVSKIARDLSETQRLHQDLQRREALLRSILDTVADGLIVIDAAGIVQSISPAAIRMFGYGEEEIMSRNIRMLMPAQQAANHDSYLQHYVDTGERRIIGIGRIVVARRKDGSTFPMELQIGEVASPGVRLFTGFVRDLTERQERDRRLAELQAELIHVSRLNELGQMVSALAHEVNQPLTAMTNYLRGIKRLLTDEMPAPLKSAIDKVAEQSERARNIVQNLRSMVRKETVERRTENLDLIVHEMSALALIGSVSNIHLAIDIPADAAAVLIDKVQIQQVLLNLMRNAVEAMHDSIRRVLTITARRRDDRIEICVADTGCGLADSVRSRLFQPFVTTKAGGLGVGLSICRTILETHGSELHVHSETGVGTEFRFSLPAANATNILSD